MKIPPEHQEAYKQLYDAGVIEDLLETFVSVIWHELQTLTDYRSKDPMLAFNGLLLDVLHNKDEFVPIIWSGRPKERTKKIYKEIPGQIMLSLFKDGEDDGS